MTTRWILALSIGLSAVILVAQNPPASGNQQQSGSMQKGAGQPASTLTTPTDKRSYGLGMDLGKQLHAQGIAVNPEIFAQGFKDAMSGGKTLLTDEEARAAVTELQAEMRQRITEARKVAGEENKKAGDAFLAENKTKQGVVTLPSGLEYKVLKMGEGKKPTVNDTVVCNYRGTLINGTEFDSSYKRNQPATFPVKGVIKGWTEALQLMPVGSKWQLFIPSDLAYGANGAGNLIGPNATLIFEVELLSIQDQH
jgi:FKBP-type peptidyl-prolyl cis-trans isomerase FklB